MNRQEMKPKTNPSARAQEPPVGRPRQGGKKRPSPALLRLLHRGMLLLSAVILLLGLALIILPTFRVQTVSVEGASFHTPEEIIEASGIYVGQEILSIDKNAVNLRIWESCKYVDEISIVSSFDSIRIVVTELPNVMYTKFNDTYVSLDRNFRVIGQTENEADFSSFLYVELPEIASLSLGKTLSFENESIDLTYVTDLLDALAEDGRIERVTSIDFSKKYGVSFVLDGRCRVKLGRVGSLDSKLAVMDEILSMKGESTEIFSLIDVSNLQKPTYRVLSSSDLLMN